MQGKCEIYRLEVPIENYVFFSKEQVDNNKAKGFFTKNACECVSGYLSSDQGYAFFHFYRLNNATELTSLIKRDFAKASNLQLTLIGGNPVNMCFPWNAKKRSLTFFHYDKQLKNLIEHKDEKAMAHLQTELLEFNEYYSYFHVHPTERDEINNIINCCITNENSEGLLSYDFKKLNTLLKEKQFLVSGFDETGTFVVQGIKDLIAYQNLASVAEAVNKTNLISKTNISHYNCPTHADLYADFDGKIGVVKDNENQKLLKLDELIFDKLNRARSTLSKTSLNKQAIIPNLKIR